LDGEKAKRRTIDLARETLLEKLNDAICTKTAYVKDMDIGKFWIDSGDFEIYIKEYDEAGK
jgi:hypothetical protein